MNKFLKVNSLVISMTIFCGLTLFSCLFKYSYSSSPLIEIQNQYAKDFDQLINETYKMVDVASKFENYPSQKNEAMLQQKVSSTRLAYKKIEFLLEYLDPEFTLKYINGAPLPKLMKHVPEITVIKPNGLQTLDELSYLDPYPNKSEMEELAIAFEKNIRKAQKFHANKKLEHRFIVEGIRYGVLRVFTLGLTGFDTPGSGNAIEEALISMESMRSALAYYHWLELKESQSELRQILQLFDASIKYLGNAKFETLDRLHFLTEYADPLYNLLLKFQKKSNIELRKESDISLHAHNYESEHIFEESFFNPAYYTKIAESDLNDDKKIELGKLLFYDPILSQDLNMSCASCHNPQKGFADGLSKAKTTKEGIFTERHSPTLLNSALYGRYFWDMREYDLERQIKHVVHNELEFNMDFIELTERLKQSSEYLNLFEDAYGDRDKYKISTWSISNSLAAYVNSLTQYNSKFDQFARGEIKQIDPEIRKGFNLFMGKAACGTCHFAPSFSGLVPPFYTDSESEVLGITTAFDTINPSLDTDPGRVANGLAQEEAMHFHRSMKTVTVRNAGITAPYMHNGSLNSLEEVMHFYNKGGGAGMGLEIENQTLPDAHLNLNTNEISNLVKFVESLTDTVGMTDYPIQFPKFEQKPEWDDRTAY